MISNDSERSTCVYINGYGIQKTAKMLFTYRKNQLCLQCVNTKKNHVISHPGTVSLWVISFSLSSFVDRKISKISLAAFAYTKDNCQVTKMSGLWYYLGVCFCDFGFQRKYIRYHLTITDCCCERICFNLTSQLYALLQCITQNERYNVRYFLIRKK